jgi:hypothetical protein
MFANDLLEVINKSYRDPWKLEVGQILWSGAKASEKPNYGKNSKKTPMTHVVLTLVSREDLEMKNAGYSDKEIKETKIARLFKEAYEQGALLIHSDNAYLRHVSRGTISKQTKAYMERTGEILPTRGIIHDIGRAMTNKRIILKLCKKGYQTPDIGRMTNHAQEANDMYIKTYKKVEKLSKTMKNEEIAQILGMGKSLVEEYIRILNKKE